MDGFDERVEAQLAYVRTLGEKRTGWGRVRNALEMMLHGASHISMVPRRRTYRASADPLSDLEPHEQDAVRLAADLLRAQSQLEREGHTDAGKTQVLYEWYRDRYEGGPFPR